MKLYYSPVACSLADHIALREADVDLEIERVDLATKLTAGGAISVPSPRKDTCRRWNWKPERS
ncbi:hypothetical protein PMI09_00526 [Rhizobium sp. CF122]|nr:hypothetical protein PMI09_00526 [Rhizobium sp. CF122]